MPKYRIVENSGRYRIQTHIIFGLWKTWMEPFVGVATEYSSQEAAERRLNREVGIWRIVKEVKGK